MRSPRWAVFLSGRGSNAEAVWEHLHEMDVVLCVSSRRKAYGLCRARRLGIAQMVFGARSDWGELSQELKRRGVNRIFLLGFMRLLPEGFVNEWAGRIWNLHPSLLPAFPGLAAIEKSFEAGGAMGVTVHEVVAEMDAGPLCLQKKISDQAQVEMSLSGAQLKISQTEQRLVREWMTRVNGGL
jgi:phosphoribosylglycinamide formyltransferase-1